tara:strand:- start:1213 stop:1392 length:180 start_codon:yes stop_codon:yes gene_type:complete
MPRKKLTKTQVLLTIQKMKNNLSKLFYDKVEQTDSKVPMSPDAMLKIVNTLANATKRVK